MNESAIESAAQARKADHLALLLTSVRTRSVSLTGEGIAEHVAFLSASLKERGFSVEVFSTSANPIILAEIGPPTAPFTLLTYGHYDVYPADRAQEGWRTEPFEPVIDGDRIWGRGTGDNKGQHWAVINAIDTWRQSHGELPIRIKMILEGDEETGSKPLPEFIAAHRNRLKADCVVYSDGPMLPADQPVLLMGVRGLLGLEFHATGASRNLHSGNFGGVAPNPTHDLMRLLSSMTDREGRLTVPGTAYDDVTIDPLDHAAVNALPLDLEGIRESMGCAPVTGTDGALYHERLMLRPALNISGFAAGYTGEGQKTIIYKEARAKADIRLVGGQDPQAVFAAIERFVRESGYHNISVTLLKAQPASRTALNHPVVPVVKQALAAGFDREVLVVPSLGGTTPDYVFTQMLGLPSVVVPLAPFDENNHAPNESTKVSIYLAGIKSYMHLIAALGRMAP